MKKLLKKQKTSMNNFTSVIAAISTPPGKGGVAIIRISGVGSLEVAAQVFRPVSNKSFAEVEVRKQIRGRIFYGDNEIDDGMATYFKAPNSYTGEDTVEISCHGGALITKTVLEAVLASGARVAEPGEFTRRAFINGKLSLTEAEAIGSLLDAESYEQILLSSEKSRTLLSDSISKIRRKLTDVLSSLYARIDYPDEDLGDFSNEEAVSILKSAKKDTERLLSTYRTGKAINEGIRTVICGKPNVGKSSLYNLLLKRDAAIVTDIQGTTRDVLTEKISLGRVVLVLSDTAGVRKSSDPIEKIGIQRSREKIKNCELILAVFDTSMPIDSEDEDIIKAARESSAAKIAILNKSDLDSKIDKSRFADFDAVLEISAKYDSDSVDEKLKNLIDKFFTDEKIVIGNEAIIASYRQNAALARADKLISSSILAYEMGIGQDAASSDAERALAAISELDGRAVCEEIVADIFSKFCVGK